VDHAPGQQLDTYLLAPLSFLWSSRVLRPARVYAMLTCGATVGNPEESRVGIREVKAPILPERKE